MPDAPLAELPDSVVFTLDEIAQILFAVDVAVELASVGGAEAVRARTAQRLITGRIWQELGALMDEEDQE